MSQFGEGKFTYRLAEGWGNLPEGHEFGQVAGVASDSQGRVHLFNRSSHPVQVFDMEGNFLRSWGGGAFANPHGITIAPTTATGWRIGTPTWCSIIPPKAYFY